MTSLPVILRGTPGTDGWKPPGREHRGRTLGSQLSLYWHAAADANEEGDRFGVIAALVARGRLVLHGVIVVGDDLAARDPAALAGIGRWAKAHPLDTATGPAPWRVVTAGEFFDPMATREATDERDAKPWAFVPNAYNRGAGPIVGCDLGRTVGLVVEHVERRTGQNVGSWQMWLPGWGTPNPAQRKVDRVSPHRPPLWVRSRRKGWTVRFAPCPPGHGTRPPPFLDVLTAAYALDADKAAGFVDHARHFGVGADPLPVAVSVDADGAARMAEAVRSVHALALALDEAAAKWFTTAQDRGEWATRFPLAWAHSPAGLADHLLRRIRVAAPLGHFALDPAEDAAWWEAFHGGWCDDVAALRGRPFGAVALDVTSAYPLTAHLVGWWEVMTADRLVRRSVLGELRALCRRAVDDPTVALDPAVWTRFGLTLCEVAPDGEHFPVALDDPHRLDGRTETVPVTARGRTMFYGWPDVVAATILSGRVPRIVRAVRLVPEGRQGGLRRLVPVYPGLTLLTDRDPVLGLVRRRREAKAAGDKVLAAELHAMTNSLVSGQPARLDDVRRVVRGKWTVQEKAGPWTFAPLGVTATASARLLLAAVDRQVRDLGGVVAYRDTDSSIIPASPDGGAITLADRATVRELSYPEIDRLLAGFDRLSPDPAWPVWKRSPAPGEDPLRCIVFGPKRHVEYRGSDEAPELVDWTEAGLGGAYADPPTMQGRCADGGQAWSKAAVEREVRYAAAKLSDPKAATRAQAPWDAAGTLPFPTLRRLQVTTPRLGDTLPSSLGAHVGSRYVEALLAGTVTQGVRSVVAVDPGGALCDWQALGWVDRASGEPVKATTDMLKYGSGAVILDPLDFRAGDYGAAPKGAAVVSVAVTPLSVVYRGRVSPVLDAVEDGMPDPARFRVRYEDDHGLGPSQRPALVALARSMPTAAFAELAKVTPRTARLVARDQLPRRSTVERILVELRRGAGAWIVPGERTCGCGCGEALPADRRGYVDAAHRERAKKRRARATRSPESGGPWPVIVAIEAGDI